MSAAGAARRPRDRGLAEGPLCVGVEVEMMGEEVGTHHTPFRQIEPFDRAAWAARVLALLPTTDARPWGGAGIFRAEAGCGQQLLQVFD